MKGKEIKYKEKKIITIERVPYLVNKISNKYTENKIINRLKKIGVV